MIKCRFVDIKDISSDVPRSNFVESELEHLANLILATDGLIRPLILNKVGAETYVVIEGHRKYYAALIAKEKNNSKAEMVNAFVISTKVQSSAIKQLQLLNKERSPVMVPASTFVDVEQLLPSLSAAIFQQIQPLVEQLAEQKKMLEMLILDRTNSSTVRVKIIEPPDISKPKDPPPVESVKIVEPAKVGEPKPPKPAEKEKLQPDPVTIANTSEKVATLPELINPINPTLNLINTLSQNELVLAMERSGVSKAAIKLVPLIITSRDSQLNRKFDTWEEVTAAKITGLGPAKIKEIIGKLK